MQSGLNFTDRIVKYVAKWAEQKTKPASPSRGHVIPPSPRFVLFVFSSFCFVPVFCLSRQVSPLAASPHARRSREISTTGCGYPKPAGWFSSSRVATPPCPPACLWLNARRPTSDSMPASDSSPPDRRWLKPAGSPLTHARQSPLTLAPWIQSTSRLGVPCHVPRVMVFKSCLALRNSFNVSCRSCPWRFVWGRRLFL